MIRSIRDERSASGPSLPHRGAQTAHRHCSNSMRKKNSLLWNKNKKEDLDLSDIYSYRDKVASFLDDSALGNDSVFSDFIAAKYELPKGSVVRSPGGVLEALRSVIFTLTDGRGVSNQRINIIAIGPCTDQIHIACILNGVQLRKVASSPSDDSFEEDLEDLADNHTVALFVANPNHVTGGFLDGKSGRNLGIAADRLRLPLVVDETFRELVHLGSAHEPLSYLKYECPSITVADCFGNSSVSKIVMNDIQSRLSHGNVPESLRKYIKTAFTITPGGARSTLTPVQAVKRNLKKRADAMRTIIGPALANPLGVHKLFRSKAALDRCLSGFGVFIELDLDGTQFASDGELVDALFRDMALLLLPGSALDSTVPGVWMALPPEDKISEVWARLRAFGDKYGAKN
mmetsp:Transcript_4416/g.11437  ORF Transcript_4416/g.11437 Transcript_4416/m.11437 type:complete len:402 (+) Transcript_4416:712-1917(+)